MVTTTHSTIITMTDKSLIQLMTLLSPVFPVGGFAYSGGLETATKTGAVSTRDDLRSWIETSLSCGLLRNDSILLSLAHRSWGDEEGLFQINELALALSGSAERYEESINLGAAFVGAARPWVQDASLTLPNPCAYSVAIGSVTAHMGLNTEQVLHAYLQAACSNQLQAALRLMSLGQQAAVSLQHELEPLIQRTAQNAVGSSPDDLGTCTPAMDIAALNHETLTSRIFRS